MKKRLILLALACSLAGCGSSPLIPDKTLSLTSSLSYPLGKLVSVGIAGLVIYLVYDPLAPNWEIQEARLNEDTYRLDMRMKRYHTGGAGESMQILRRRAAQLQRERGYGGYELLEYTEGIDSKTLGTERVAEGTIRLIDPPKAASPDKNG